MDIIKSNFKILNSLMQRLLVGTFKRKSSQLQLLLAPLKGLMLYILMYSGITHHSLLQWSSLFLHKITVCKIKGCSSQCSSQSKTLVFRKFFLLWKLFYLFTAPFSGYITYFQSCIFSTSEKEFALQYLRLKMYSSYYQQLDRYYVIIS